MAYKSKQHYWRHQEGTSNNSNMQNTRNNSAYRSPGRSGWPRSSRKWDFVEPDLVKNPLGKLMVSIRLSDLELPAKADSAVDACISNCEYVASYNWITGKPFRITVPGEGKKNRKEKKTTLPPPICSDIVIVSTTVCVRVCVRI